MGKVDPIMPRHGMDPPVVHLPTRPLQEMISLWNISIICDTTNHISYKIGFPPIQLVQLVHT